MQQTSCCFHRDLYALQGIDTAAPTVLLPDGSQLPGSYEQSTGSHLIFKEDAGDMQLQAKTDTVLKIACSSRPAT